MQMYKKPTCEFAYTLIFRNTVKLEFKFKIEPKRKGEDIGLTDSFPLGLFQTDWNKDDKKNNKKR